MRKLALGLAFVFLASAGAQAQQNKQNVNKTLDFTYKKENVQTRKVVPYPNLREADVIYARRVERVIDSREKKNHIMNWPKSPLNRITYTWATTGEENSTGKLKAYKTDSLDKAYTISEIGKIGGYCETVQMPNPLNPDDPYDLIDTLVCTPFDVIEIKRWKIVEDWIFDKQRGMFFPRIIAIAPLYVPKVNGVELNEQAMFYYKWEELRPMLINEEVFNRSNDAMRLTYYDWFEMRLFSSYIVKTSNENDWAINEYPEYKDNPMEALYASEEAKEMLFNFEHDLWEY